RPRRVALAPGAAAELVLVASPPRAAPPGDHAALILLTTRAPPGAAVPIRMRLGVTVGVRVPGEIAHKLVLWWVRVVVAGHARVLRVAVANRGNVVEWLRRGQVEIGLLASGRRVARLSSSPRELLPGAVAIFELPFRGGLRGRLTAIATLA